MADLDESMDLRRVLKEALSDAADEAVSQGALNLRERFRKREGVCRCAEDDFADGDKVLAPVLFEPSDKPMRPVMLRRMLDDAFRDVARKPFIPNEPPYLTSPERLEELRALERRAFVDTEEDT